MISDALDDGVFALLPASSAYAAFVGEKADDLRAVLIRTDVTKAPRGWSMRGEFVFGATSMTHSDGGHVPLGSTTQYCAREHAFELGDQEHAQDITGDPFGTYMDLRDKLVEWELAERWRKDGVEARYRIIEIDD